MESKKPIHIEHINFIVRNTVMSSMEHDPQVAKYDAQLAMRSCKYLANEIRFRLKFMRYDRYRYVVMVNIFENRVQAIDWKFGFLWDIDTDQWTAYQHETQAFTVTAVVLAVYWE